MHRISKGTALLVPMLILVLAVSVLLAASSPALAARKKAKPEAGQGVSKGAGAQLLCPAEAGLGEPFVVRVRSSKAFSSATVSFLKRSAPLEVRRVAGEGGKAPVIWEAVALVGTDVLGTATGQKEILVRLGKGRTLRAVIHIRRVKRPTESLDLSPEMVNPPASELPRIAAERAQAQAVLAMTSPKLLFRLPFTRPVPGELSSMYGIGRVLNGQPRAPHRGLDLEAEVGQPVVAAADGHVVLVGDFYYAGRCIYVDHGQGVFSMYFHLSEQRVENGQKVSAGEVIGLAGATGRSTRSHLHFGVSTLGRLVDPAPLFGYDALP